MIPVRRTPFLNFNLRDPKFDKFVFIGFLLSGILLIPWLRAFGISALEVSAIPVASISLYVIAALYLKSHRSQPDRTADNCYYMGLIFAVVSLSCSLYQHEFPSCDLCKYPPNPIEEDGKIEVFDVRHVKEEGAIQISHTVHDIRSLTDDVRDLIASAIDLIRSQISDFGVAIAIAIGGMIGRMLFNQWRTDSAELE